MFERVLIANRGEIACRVIRTCRRLGIHTIAVYSQADANAQHVRLADEAWPIGGPRPTESYLRGDAILEVARKSGAQAIHPGYGFLSENTAFARACADAGIVFIGPRPESIDAMGSKAAAKALMERHQVPLVPGYHGEDQSAGVLAEQARRTAMGAAAVAAAKAVNYVGAGTVEFIVAQNGEFFFMEMNTRLQVEHPVTEETLGLDLVEWQLRIAAGQPLPLAQEQIKAHGHAIEVRLYAEDPDQNFLPGSGKLVKLRLPAPSRHVRLDGGVIEGDTVTIFYDPMIAKLIVWDVDRAQALQRLRDALMASEIVGPKSNIAFLERLSRHPVVVEGRIDTGYLDRHLDQFLAGDVAPAAPVLFAAAVAALVHDEGSVASNASDPHSPWSRADAWRVGHAGKRIVALSLHGQRHEVEAHGHDGNYQLRCGDASCDVQGARLGADALSARFDGEALRVPVHTDAARVTVHDTRGYRYAFERAPAFAWESKEATGGNQITAPMPGRIVLVKAQAGDTVEEGQELLVMEAMKMELALKAPRGGNIASVHATQGDFVEADTVLLRFAD